LYLRHAQALQPSPVPFAACGCITAYVHTLYLVPQMVQFSIDTYFPEAAEAAQGPGGLPAGALKMFEAVVASTAKLVAQWQVMQ
jgi:uncharacterized protein YdiU (UPF0061 family)